MTPDLAFWLSALLKVGLSAAFVVTASFVTERAGPVIGSLVATLPLSTGPAYVLIALDHDAEFIAACALVGLALHPASIFYTLVYAAMAQRHGLALSVASGAAVWFAFAVAINGAPWTTAGAVLFNIVTFLVCAPLARRFVNVKMPPVVRRWYDVPMRAALVSVLAALIILLSGKVGPGLTGVIAVFPAIFTSLILILHPRIGGPTTAGVIANGTYGLMGFAAGLLTVNLAAVPLGKWLALLAGLVVAALWNVGLWTLWRSSLVERLRAALHRPS